MNACIGFAYHIVSGPRLPFTAAYFGSIVLTLYFSLGVSPFSSVLILAACAFCIQSLRSSPSHAVVVVIDGCLPGSSFADNVRVTSCIAPFSLLLRLSHSSSR